MAAERTAIAQRQPAADLPVFSERLSTVIDGIIKGEAPNAGRFCGFCYTPIAAERTRCLHCDQPVDRHTPVERIPREIIDMFRRMRRRESLVVNSFAYAGLLLGVLIFVAVFYAVFTLGGSVWWYVFDIVLLFVLARALAGLLGGFVGDELGFRYSRRKLAEEWQTFEAGREGS